MFSTKALFWIGYSKTSLSKNFDLLMLAKRKPFYLNPFTGIWKFGSKRLAQAKSFLVSYKDELLDFNSLYVCTKQAIDKIGLVSWYDNFSYMLKEVQKTPGVRVFPFIACFYLSDFGKNVKHKLLQKILEEKSKFTSELEYLTFIRLKYGFTQPEILWGLFLLKLYLQNLDQITNIISSGKIKNWNFLGLVAGGFKRAYYPKFKKILEKSYSVTGKYIYSSVESRFLTKIFTNPKVFRPYSCTRAVFQITKLKTGSSGS